MQAQSAVLDLYPLTVQRSAVIPVCTGDREFGITAVVVHRHKHVSPAEGILLCGQHQLLIVPPGQCLFLPVDLSQRTDNLQAWVLTAAQFIQIQPRPDLIVGSAPGLSSLDAEFRSVIHRRDPRQAEKQDVHRQPVPLVVQLGMDALHVVVVHKAVERPAVDTVLHEAVDRMGNFEIVVVVVAAVERLVQGIIRHRVQHSGIHPALVLAMDHLTHQPEFRLDGVRQVPQRPHEIKVQHVGGVQAQPVDVEL